MEGEQGKKDKKLYEKFERSKRKDKNLSHMADKKHCFCFVFFCFFSSSLRELLNKHDSRNNCLITEPS